MQVGGYNWGNGTDGIYQGRVGGDFKFPSGGVVSVDGTASFAKDALNLGTFGTLTQCAGYYATQTVNSTAELRIKSEALLGRVQYAPSRKTRDCGAEPSRLGSALAHRRGALRLAGQPGASEGLAATQ